MNKIQKWLEEIYKPKILKKKDPKGILKNQIKIEEIEL